jgi:eukaryotic-like serine/threonine-protein kinase
VTDPGKATATHGSRPGTSSVSEEHPRLLPQIGKYTVLGVLGRGGMGLVYKGYDSDLDRRVAIKVFHRQGTADDSQARAIQARAMREAQALAKLSHPNIVAVHEVGTFEQQNFIVMEYVKGGTLREMLRARPPYAQVIDVFVQIGRALAAAHYAGIIHRDLKPENVVVDADGHPQVLDFGLARAADMVEIERSSRNHTSPPRDSAQMVTLTSPGDLIGTPAYMAPEQLLRERACERSDQYAFCVSLYEALYGERPFVAATVDALRVAVLSGAIPQPAKPAYPVPAYLRAALLRGLSFAREERFPSMDALVAVIVAGERRRKLHRILAGGLGLAALTGAAAGLLWLSGGSQAGTCQVEPPPIDRPAQVRLERAMLAGGDDFAGHGLAQLRRTLEHQRVDLAAAHQQLCAHRHDWSITTREAADACLEEAQWSLAALTDALTDASPATTRLAADASAELPAAASCLDPAALARRPPTPTDPDARARSAAVRRALARARVLLTLGETTRAQALSEQLLAVAPAAHEDHLLAAAHEDHLLAEIQLLRGLAIAQGGDPRRAESVLQEATRQAAEVGAEPLLVDGLCALTRVAGEQSIAQPTRREEALLRGELALALAVHLGPAGQRRRAEALRELARVHLAHAELKPAERRLREAVALLEAELAPDHPAVLAAVGELAQVLARSEPGPVPLRLATRVVFSRREGRGANHPSTATALYELANIQSALGELDTAATTHREALQIRETVLGERHPDVARSLAALGLVARARGQLVDAEQWLARSLAGFERAYGPWHPQVAAALDELAWVRTQRGHIDEAQLLRARATQIRGHAPRE